MSELIQSELIQVFGTHSVYDRYEFLDSCWSASTEDLKKSTQEKHIGKFLRIQTESRQSVFSDITSSGFPLNIDGQFSVWLIGEIYKCSWLNYEAGCSEKSTKLLLSEIIRHCYKQDKWEDLSSVDGQYILIIYAHKNDHLIVVNDRFGGIPFYFHVNSRRLIFSTSLSLISAFPEFNYYPDLEAIKEAVSFGGFRLGNRTTVRDVKMLPWSSVLMWQDFNFSLKRYWNPEDTCRQPLQGMSESDLVEKGYNLWQAAMKRRLVGVTNPGQTLSGGLDSRAILAEAIEKFPNWTAISFGVPRCDDVRYALKSAEVVGSRWIYHPLYYSYSPDWVEQRSRYIWDTGGMVDLFNLQHWETLPLQATLIDTNLSGFIGDAVCGGSLDSVQDVHSLLPRLPYYFTSIGLNRKDAEEKVFAFLKKDKAWPIKYLFYEMKVAQQTNLLFQAPFNKMKVKKPFVDYDLFDFFESLPFGKRKSLYLKILRRKYPDLYKNIPNQKTGMPILTPKWIVNLERIRRLVYKKTQPFLGNQLGLPFKPRVRNFIDDHLATSMPSAEKHIKETILAPNSLVSEVFGRKKLVSFLQDWFEHSSVPSNSVGALYVFEKYHREINQKRQGYLTVKREKLE